MDTYFPGDNYSTDPNTARLFLDRLLLGSRWGLYLSFARVVFDSRAASVKGIYDDEAFARSSHRILRMIEGCGGRFEVEGLDNLRKIDGPVVFASNHVSTLETLIFPVLITPIKPVTYVVKEKLTRAAIFGPIMRSRNPITVTRKDPRRDLDSVMKTGPRILAEGTSVIIFPQSTRRAVFTAEQFNSLAVKLAGRADVPVLPVAIKTDFWDNGRILRGFGPLRRERTIHFAFGEAIPVAGRGKTEHVQVVTFIREHLRNWGGRIGDEVEGY